MRTVGLVFKEEKKKTEKPKEEKEKKKTEPEKPEAGDENGEIQE